MTRARLRETRFRRFGTLICAAVLGTIFPGAVAADKIEPSEWTIEQARRCWKPMTRAVQHVGVPGYQFQTGVTWDGALVFGPLEFYDFKVIRDEMAPLGKHLMHVSFGFGETMRLVDRQGTLHPQIRRSIEQGRLPIPHVETRDGDLSWNETVFAHLLDRPMEPWPEPKPGDMLVDPRRVPRAQHGPARRTGHLWMHFGDTKTSCFGYKCRQVPEIGQPIAFRFESPYGRLGDGVRFVCRRRDKGVLNVHAGGERGGGRQGPAKNVVEWSVPLAPGEEAELRLLIPYGVVSQKRPKRWSPSTVRKHSTRFAAIGMNLQRNASGQIHTPDPFVNDYLAAGGRPDGPAGGLSRPVDAGLDVQDQPESLRKLLARQRGQGPAGVRPPGLDGSTGVLLQSFIDMRTDDVGGLNRAGWAAARCSKAKATPRSPASWASSRVDGQSAAAEPRLGSLGAGRRTTGLRATTSGSARRKRSPLQAMIDAFDWVSNAAAADDARGGRQKGAALGTAAGRLGPRLAGRKHDLQRRLLHLRHGRGGAAVAARSGIPAPRKWPAN